MKSDPKKIAIWLDLNKAHIIPYTSKEASIINTIDSPYQRQKRIDGETSDHTRFGSSTHYTSNNENNKNNISQNQLNQYFKSLEKNLAEYDHILLLGPGIAKEQLNNFLKLNKKFSDKKIIVKNLDYTTENQLLAYVREFYGD